jgi:hypothetical protein
VIVFPSSRESSSDISAAAWPGYSGNEIAYIYFSGLFNRSEAECTGTFKFDRWVGSHGNVRRYSMMRN